MEITIFASGSSGNCSVVTDGKVNILIDAGISLRRIAVGLRTAGLAPEALDGVLVTHEHSDHISGLPMVRAGEDYKTITGNQMGVLLLDYIITARKRNGTLPKNAGAVKSIVTTEMAREVCVRNGVHIEDTFTGFKFMAERIAEWEAAKSYQYIFAYEESYGYMPSTRANLSRSRLYSLVYMPSHLPSPHR